MQNGKTDDSVKNSVFIRKIGKAALFAMNIFYMESFTIPGDLPAVKVSCKNVHTESMKGKSFTSGAAA